MSEPQAHVATAYLARVALVFFALLSLFWLAYKLPALQRYFSLWQSTPAALWGLLSAFLIYLLAHGTRMLRLAILSLDAKEHAWPLALSHALTAFASSFFPLKMGELLRLATFLFLMRDKPKALAIWFVERAADLSVLFVMLLMLSLFSSALPASVTLAFAFVSMLGCVLLFGFFAINGLLGYLSRYLLLQSRSLRGLRALQLADALKTLTRHMHQVMEGRLLSLLLLSLVIWALELAAIAILVTSLSDGAYHSLASLFELFGKFLLISLPSSMNFVHYQPLALACLSLVAAVWALRKLPNLLRTS